MRGLDSLHERFQPRKLGCDTGNVGLRRKFQESGQKLLLGSLFLLLRRGSGGERGIEGEYESESENKRVSRWSINWIFDMLYW
jgi:hypothetical protein